MRLPCVKRHKLEVGCNGMRDKVAFVPLGKFNEMNLLSDYRFLEDVGRLTDGANRDDLIRKFTSNKYLNSLRSLARKYSVHLKLLPIGFTKRKENSTMFHKKAQVIFWHLKLIFVQSQCEFVEKRYYKLDPTKSLIENLKNKTIIEYPTLHIVLKDQASRYLILGQGTLGLSFCNVK
uniref:BCD1 alpha/beta domain-containing protein n=1 Tax=Erpetoichthys calabaricus TaxID=27687 RepID=A0A8C4SEF5_ERPCA